MKIIEKTITAKNAEEGLSWFMHWVGVGINKYEKVSVTIGQVKERRSLPANNLSWVWYREIAQHGSMTVDVAHRTCKLHHGVPILRSTNQEFRDFYDANLRGMSYEDKLVLMKYIPVTSQFSPKEMSEYIDTIQREYAQQGLVLSAKSEEYMLWLEGIKK